MLLSQILKKLAQFRTRLQPFKRSLAILAIGLPLLVLSSGCSPALNRANMMLFSPPLELTIRQVEASSPGIYTVSGSTTLPDQTQITVSAIRYLQPEIGLTSSAESAPAYSILDRKMAEVNQGNWQTELSLWQVAPNGKYAEPWQLGDTDITYEPGTTVTFLATLDPANQPSNLQSRVENLDPNQQVALMRFTTDGELYVQASETLTVNLPTEVTTPSAPPAPSANASPAVTEVTPRSSSPTATEGWQQTSAPLSPEHLLR